MIYLYLREKQNFYIRPYSGFTIYFNLKVQEENNIEVSNGEENTQYLFYNNNGEWIPFRITLSVSPTEF